MELPSSIVTKDLLQLQIAIVGLDQQGMSLVGVDLHVYKCRSASGVLVGSCAGIASSLTLSPMHGPRPWKKNSHLLSVLSKVLDLSRGS